MKMIQAVIRPDRENEVIESLEEKGFSSVTKWDVFGRGKQRGIQVESMVYDELAKVMLMVVVEDRDFTKAMDAIKSGAYTGNFGDGKVFVSEVGKVFTIRTGEKR